MKYLAASILGLAGLAATLPIHDRGLPSYVSHLKRVPNSRLQARQSSAPLYSQAQRLLTEISFGTQSFYVSIDTGSSNTWVVSTGYTCLNQNTLEPEPQADCGLSTTQTYDFDTSFTLIPDENFNTTYEDGTWGNGVVGYESVTLAGVPVSSQEVGIVDKVRELKGVLSSA